MEKKASLECLALVAFLVVVAVVVAAIVVAVTVPQFPLHRDLALQVPACYYCDFFLVLGHDMRRHVRFLALRTCHVVCCHLCI